jgi:DNA/RNA endonuclease YhcR with UshA esterase domain
MRPVALLLVFLGVTFAFGDDKQAKPITPAEAAKKVNEKVTVEMEVKSTGGNTARFLNSEKDFKDEKNFTVFIPESSMEKFKKAKIDEPKTYYDGKTILVTGTVTLYQKKAQIKVEDPEQIKVKEKAAEKK